MPRPREPPVFFIDHCLGTKKVAERLRQAGAEVRVLVEDGFDEGTDDVDWLPRVAAQGWAVLTKDARVRRRPIERAAIMAARAGAFVLTAGGLGGDAVADAFARALPRMIRTVTAHGVVTVVDGGERAGGLRRD